MIGRRRFLSGFALPAFCPLLACDSATRSDADEILITGFELIPVRVTDRTVWLFLRLQTNAGLTGLGEASNAFGSANTTAENVAEMEATIAGLLSLFDELSPLAVPLFRQEARRRAAENRVAATAFSAIEQAMWDLSGKAFAAPVWKLLGGKVRDSLPAYANINRAVTLRTPDGFADMAASASTAGFEAVKAAPFDGFPVNGTSSEITAHIESGIEAVFAMRAALGPNAALMIDGHSFFSVEQAVAVARQLEPAELTWYEEPVAPLLVDETLAIKERIVQEMAGGEVLFGVAGFEALISRRAVDVIMPDVKHCGGLREFMQIAAAAEEQRIAVSPHNPSGPVSTAASIHVSACIQNFNYLELQYGEAQWRSEIINPPEQVVNGSIAVPESPGFGVSLNEVTINQFGLPL